jgi:hypothetical protein
MKIYKRLFFILFVFCFYSCLLIGAGCGCIRSDIEEPLLLEEETPFSVREEARIQTEDETRIQSSLHCAFAFIVQENFALLERIIKEDPRVVFARNKREHDTCRAGFTLLHEAYSYFHGLSFIFGLEANLRREPSVEEFKAAAYERFSKVAQILFKYVKDEDKDALLFAQTEVGDTVLLNSVIEKKAQVVQFIHDNISSEQRWRQLICSQNLIGQSPASIACEQRDKQIVELFDTLFGKVSASDGRLKTDLDNAVASLNVRQVAGFVSRAKNRIRRRNIAYLYWIALYNFQKIQSDLELIGDEEIKKQRKMRKICDHLESFLSWATNSEPLRSSF